MPNGQDENTPPEFPTIFTNKGHDPITTKDANGNDITLQPGDAIEVEDACAMVRTISSARRASDPSIRAVVLEQSQGALKALCDWAATHCPDASCYDTTVAAAGASGQPVDGKKSTDSGSAQGAPEITANARAEGSRGKKQDAPPSPVYGPSDEELAKSAHPAPIGGDASSETASGGDPVDLSRGSLSIVEADLVIPNTVLPMALVRTYRSGYPYPGPFSWNWDHNHNIYLRELEPPAGQTSFDVVRWSGNLHEDRFRYNGAGFDSPRGVFQTLEKLPILDPNGEYRIRDVGGVTWYFARPSGWSDAYRIPLSSVVDRFGNALTYVYDSQNRLQTVSCKPVDAMGATASGPYHFLQFSYGECGLLESVTDSLGRQVRYWHDPDIQHLLRVMYPGTTDHPEGAERRYHYGDPFLPETLRHNILRIEDGHGKVYVENAYDEDPSSWSYGRLVRQIHGGNLFQFSYTQIQWLPPNDVYVNVPTQRTEVLDPNGGLTTYTFNFRGDMLDRRTRLAADGSFWIAAVAFEYDSQGNRTKVRHVRDFLYSDAGVVDHIWGLGEERTYHHDHADPRMRGMLAKVESLDGNLRETVWEGTYDAGLQLLLTEHGLAGDGFSSTDLTTTYHYSTDSKGKLLKISHPAATLPDGTSQSAETQFEVNTRGQTTAIITPEGIRHELRYNESAGLGIGRLLTKKSDAGTGGIGAEQTFSYDTNGFLATVTDPTGATTTYTYNVLGQIEQVTQPTIGGSAVSTHMRYDADGMLVEVRRPRGGYSDQTIQENYIVDRIVRNVLGHVVRSEIGANTAQPRVTLRTVDHRGLPLKSADPIGAMTRWSWDERGHLFRLEVTGTDGATTRERYIYRRDGLLQREVSGPAEDHLIDYSYGPFGRVSRVDQLHRASDGTITPSGASSLNRWSARGLLARIEAYSNPEDELLSRTEFTYDARGRMIERTLRPFSDAEPFDDSTTPRLTTEFYYDKDDRLVKVVDPRGGVTTYKYDGMNRATEEVDPIGNKTVYTYDLANRTVDIAHHDIETDGTTVKIRTWRRTSDARGRLIEMREPDGATTRFEYDDRNLLTATVQRDGTRKEYTYGLLNELLTDTLDPSGLNLVTQRSYDPVGRLISQTDPSGQSTTYTYDGIGRVVSTLRPGDAAPRTMTYGTDGLLSGSTLPSGISFAYTHDAAGRLASMSAANVPSGIDTIPRHSYSYDQLGRLTSATAGSATVTRAHDSLGRLLKETTHGELLEMAYNDLAGTYVKKWPDGREETFTTNPNGVVTKIERTANGTLGAGGATLGDFTPYGPSLIGKAALLGGVTSTISFDERKRVNRIKHEKGATLYEQIDYRYDTNNRRRGELIGAGTVQSRLHLFDTRNRLTETREGSATVTLGTTGYTQANNDTDIGSIGTALAAQSPAPIKYEFLFLSLNTGKADERLTFRKTDSVGTVTTTQYSYNTGHRLSTVGSETVTHLPDGTRQTDANNRYEVDALGRIVRVKDPTGTTTKTSLAYDPLGRVGGITSASGATSDLSYFGGTLWQERASAGVTRQFSHHPGLPGPMATHTAGATHLLHYDARLNLLAATDNSGALAQRFRYEPFGAPTPATSTTGIEPRFGGMRWLNDTGTYLAGARMMDPRHGLWLSHDPLGVIDSPNLYAYAAQNPIDYADPTGLAIGKGAGGGSSDGGSVAMGPGGGGFAGASKHISMVGGTSGKSIFYGPGDGPGIKGPEWLMDLTSTLRNVSNWVRDKIAWAADNTLGRMGAVGEFLSGFVKRGFDYVLMASPYGFAVLEEELTGAASMFSMGTDAIFNVDPSRYQRLGNMISQMPEAFMHMSKGEWGSFAFDVVVGLATGGEGAIEETAARGMQRSLASSLKRSLIKAGDRLSISSLTRSETRIGKAFSKLFGRSESVISDAESGIMRVRHHTSARGVDAIRESREIFVSRGGGVHVETQPFGPAITAAKDYGAAGHTETLRGYVEFDLPQDLPFAQGNPNIMQNGRPWGTIVTNKHLDITNLNPNFVKLSWWKIWM